MKGHGAVAARIIGWLADAMQQRGSDRSGRLVWMMILAAGLLGCRVENPRFDSASGSSELLRDSGREESTESVAGDTGAQDEVRHDDEPGQAGLDAQPASALDSTQGTQSEPDSSSADTNSTSASSSLGETTSPPKELSLCGQGERHCYLMQKDVNASQYSSKDGSGPALVFALAGMTLIQFTNGPQGPFEDFVQFTMRSMLVMQEGISVTDLSSQEFAGFDLVIRNPRCADGATRCAFARMSDLVLSVDTEKKIVICSYLVPGTVTVEGEMSVPLSTDGVNVVGCGLLKTSVWMFANGERRRAERDDRGGSLVYVKVGFGADPSLLGDSLFVGDVGLLRYWDSQTNMEAALVD